MRVKFKSLDFDLELHPDYVSCLEIHSKTYFSKVILSLISQMGEEAEEPYFLFNEAGKSIGVKNKLIIFNSLPLVPAADKKALSNIWDKVSKDMKLDDDSYNEFVRLTNRMLEIIRLHSLGMHSDLDFVLELDEKLVMKCFGFEPNSFNSLELVDNLISYFEMLLDSDSVKPIVFVNLKSFLDKNGLEELAESAFLNKIPLLLLESSCDLNRYAREEKIVVDQDFIVFDQRKLSGQDA